MTENNKLEERVFISKLAFAMANCAEVHKFHCRLYSELAHSSNLAERAIGYMGKIVWPVLATGCFPLAILVSMEATRYSKERGGYISSYREDVEWEGKSK